jgi:hypothetical protein
MKVRVKLLGINEPWEERTIPPKKMVSFFWTAAGHYEQSINIWKAGFCLQSVQVATARIVKKRIIDEDGNIEVVYEPLLDASGAQEYNPWRDVVFTWVKNEAYDAIVAAGKSFADGLADIAAKAASVALGGVPMPEFKVSGIAEAIGIWVAYGQCFDRHFDIVPDADLSSKTEKSYKFLTRKGT